MPKKTCPYCGIVDMNHVCPVVSKERNKYRNSRDDAKIYSDTRWDKVRAEVLDECNYVCLYSFYVDGEIRVADCVHHIVEVLKDKSKAYDKDDLIGLNSEVHKEVHKIYKTEYKSNLIRLLRHLKDYYNIYGLKMEDIGEYKSLIESWKEE